MKIENAYEKTEIIKASSVEPLSLQEVKSHLRIELGETDEDDLLEAMITTVREYTEDYTGRALIRSHRAAYFDNWSTNHCCLLPYPPLVAITSSTAITGNSSGAAVAYKDSTRGWNSFSSTGWIADTVSIPGRLCLEYDEDWPTKTLHNVNPIKVHFTCGYSTSSTGIPKTIKSAMKIMISDLYEQRESFIVGTAVADFSDRTLMTVKSLLANYRVPVF